MGAVLSPPLIFDRRAAPMHVSAPVYCEPKLQEPRQHPPPYKNIWFYMSFAPLLRQRWRMVVWLPGVRFRTAESSVHTLRRTCSTGVGFSRPFRSTASGPS